MSILERGTYAQIQAAYPNCKFIDGECSDFWVVNNDGVVVAYYFKGLTNLDDMFVYDYCDIGEHISTLH